MKRKTPLRWFSGGAAALLTVILLIAPVFATAVNSEDDPNKSEYYNDAYYDKEAWKTRPFHAYWTDEAHTAQDVTGGRNGRSSLYSLQNVYWSGYGYDQDGEHIALQTIMAARVWTEQDWDLRLQSEKVGDSTDTLVYTAQVQTGDVINVVAFDIRMTNSYAVSKRGSNPWMAKNASGYDSGWTDAPSEWSAFYTNIRVVHRDGRWIDGAEEFDWSNGSGDAAISSWEYTVQEGDELIYADAYANIIYRNYFTNDERMLTFIYRFEFTVSDSGFINQTETSDAEADPGQDAGTEINSGIITGAKPTVKPDAGNAPGGGYTGSTGSGDGPSTEAIALAAGGAIAAAGAVGAAVGGKKSGGEKKKKEEEEQRQKRYKMYVYKDFGDAIKKGAQPVRVYARIAEILDGKEYDCPEQTAKIRVSGEDLTVQPTGMENSWMGAQVSAQADSPRDKGAVTFTLAGPGGVFTRNVVFRLVGDPRIAFPGDGADGRWDLSVSENSVELIAGIYSRERLRFVILEAAEEPKEILFGDSKGLVIRPEKDEKLQFTYYAVIDNNTDPMEKKGGIFAEAEQRLIPIRARFSDGTETTASFQATLYPDGLSVSADKERIENDRLLVDTLPREMGGDWNGAKAIPGTPFQVCAAWLNDKGKPLIRKNPGMSHKNTLTDEGRYGLIFTENFSFHLNHGGSSGMTFYPEETLPALGEPYLAELEILCRTDGQVFEGAIPMAVTGEKPARPSAAAWQGAYAKLQKDIRIFGVGDDPQLKAMLRQVNDLSASQIEDLRKGIIEAGVFFYSEYGEAQKQYGDLMQQYVVVAASLVKAMDFALEQAMKAQWGGYGLLAAKFINPLKNLLGTYLGEYLANGDLDRAPDFLETVLQSCEESLSAAITGVFFGDDLKDGTNILQKFGKYTLRISGNAFEEVKSVLGYVIAVYLLTSFVRHYNYGKDGEKGDIYRSALAACKSLTYEMFKAWLFDSFRSLFSKIGEAAGKLIKNLCQKDVTEIAARAGGEAFGKVMRSAVRANPVNVSKSALEAARAAREAAFKSSSAAQNRILDGLTDALSEAGKHVDDAVSWVDDQAALGMLMNLFYGVDSEDAVYGASVTEIVYNYLEKRFGVLVSKVYRGELANLSETTVQIEDGKLIVGMLGVYAEIGILENIAALWDMVFDTLFSWMNAIFEGAKAGLDFNSYPDLRDRASSTADAVGRELEAAKQRIEGFEWHYTEYRKKPEYGGDTII